MNESWLWGAIGGLLIGLSSTLMLLLNGRITGISGVASGIFLPSDDSRLWRWCFIIGLIIGAGAYFYRMHATALNLPTNSYGLAFAGLLVGVGTKLGGGCTSGHGVCGMARKSPRSFTAMVVFMLVAIITSTAIYGLSS